MKNFLFAIFAFASLFAGGLASPFFGKEDTGLQGRESKDYSSHKQAIHNLYQEVLQQTGSMNNSLHGASNSLMAEDKSQLATQLNEHIKSLTKLLNQARTVKVNNNKRDTLESREEVCNEQCIYDLVYLLVYEISCTINYIISKLGIEYVFDFLTPMIMALVRLLAYWDITIVGLVISIKEVVNGLFTTIGITILAIVVN